jgi:hypothetical protein
MLGTKTQQRADFPQRGHYASHTQEERGLVEDLSIVSSRPGPGAETKLPRGEN